MLSESDELSKQVQNALAHLYDASYLESHPLARLIASETGAEAPGRVVRRLLLDSIQALKPPSEAPPETQAVARYQFLYHRYVRGESMQQITRDFAIGERQLYRRQHEAIEAITALIRSRLQRLPRDRGPALRPLAASSPVANREPDPELRSDVDRIGVSTTQTPTNLAQELHRVAGIVGNLPNAAGRHLSVTVSPALPPVQAERVAIRQAFLSLLVYLIDAYPTGEIEVEVSATSAAVSVRLLLRSDPSWTTSVPDEADSNLEVSRRLIGLQGGSLEWRAAGGSLAVTAHLPAARLRTILIVDDNPDTRHLFARYLEAGGRFRVVTASSGEEARRAVDSEAFDAVVLDVMLPGSDGWEVLQALRDAPQTAQIPVIICTVLKQRDLALSLGATEFVRKPVTQGALLAALENCLTVSRSGHLGSL